MSDDRQRRDPRNRLTTGVSRKRLQLEARRGALPTGLWIMGLVVGAIGFGYLGVHISNILGRKTYTVRLATPSAFGVFEGFDDVRYRGVPAGTITKIERDGAQVILVAKIRDKYGPIYKDAKAELRPITPLNDIYLDISDPGHASAGKADPDVPLPENQLQTSVTVPDVLDGFSNDARNGAYRLLDQLGNGSADGGAKLRQAFVALAPFVQDAGNLAAQIEHRQTATKHLVHNTSVLLEELGGRDEQLKRLVATGAATLGTLQEGSGDLDATLREIGPTFTQLQTSLSAVRGIVDDVDTGVRSLYPVADNLPTGMAALTRLSDHLQPAVAVLQRPALPGEFPRWIYAVGKLGNRAQLIGNALLPQIKPIARASVDLIRCEPDVRGFWNWNTSLSKYGDANAPIPRGNLAVDVPSSTSAGTLRAPEPNCVNGPPTIGGRPVQPEDNH